MGMITIANANALHIPLADQSVQCVVTSPPYWGLRDYGTAKWEGGSAECDHKQTVARHDAGRVNTNGFHGSAADDSDKGSINYRDTCPRCGARRIDAQIGLESTPSAYVAHIVAVMRECWRVLKDDGVLWLNLGDSYAGPKGNTAMTGGKHDEDRGLQMYGRIGKNQQVPDGLKPKDLCGIPWRVAFALQYDGWYLRSDIIWSKPNPMPESVTDRPTKAHEYVFLLTKQARYYYDAEAIREPLSDKSISCLNSDTGWVYSETRKGGDDSRQDKDTFWTGDIKSKLNPSGRNRRSVWTVATQPYSGSHFAVFPMALIEPMILAGTSARGECPHCGKAWVRVVERESPSYYQERKERDFDGRKVNGNENYTSISKGRPDNSGVGYSSNNTIGWRPQCECFGHFEKRKTWVDFGAGREYKTIMEYVPDGPQPDPIPQTVLDPFSGSGTTGMVAVKHGRKAVLLDLNTKYIDLQFERNSKIQITMQM